MPLTIKRSIQPIQPLFGGKIFSGTVSLSSNFKWDDFLENLFHSRRRKDPGCLHFTESQIGNIPAKNN